MTLIEKLKAATGPDRAWGHDELADDLAQHLLSDQRMVWTDMQMGPSGSPRPDVYTMNKSYTNPRPISYEVKVSRSDFLSDVNAGKWQKYLNFSGGVIFCVPHGLIKKTEVPQECGLMVRSENGWRTMKREKPGTGRPDFQSCMKMLIDGVNRTVSVEVDEPKRYNAWAVHKSVRRDLGVQVAEVVRNHLLADERVKYREREADKLLAEARVVLSESKAEASKKMKAERVKLMQSLEELRHEAARALGLPLDTNWQKIGWERFRICRELSMNETFRAMELELADLRNIISDANVRAAKLLPSERALQRPDLLNAIQGEQ